MNEDGTKQLVPAALIGGGLAVAFSAIAHVLVVFAVATLPLKRTALSCWTKNRGMRRTCSPSRKMPKTQQDVVVVGRIGGRVNPWVKGTAAFPIVDRSLKPCNEIEGDTCETPWDYCCEAELPKATCW